MTDVVSQILAVDAFTAWVVIVLALWATTIVGHMTQSTLVAMYFLPAMGMGAMVSLYLFREAEIYFSPAQDANVIITASIGMIVMMLVMLVLMRTIFVLRDRRKTGLENRGSAA